MDVVTGCILLAGNVIGPTDDTPDYTASRRYIRSRTLWELLNFSMYSRLVRRTLVVDNAIFLAEGVTCGEDPLWVYMLHKKIASAARCKKIVYTYRQNEESVMHQKDSTKNYCSQLWTAVLAARAFGPDGRWAETKYLQDLLSLGRRRRAYGNSDETKVAARLKEVYREITRTSVPWQVKWWAWRLQLPYRTATSRLVKLADRFVGLTLKAISR